METKANSFIVGVFALIAVAAVAFFTWWQAAGTSGATRDVVFLFPGSVAGLTSGSPVLFNGIKVGDVRGVALDETNLEQVRVFAKVEEDAPLKQNTRVAIETQGITGYASIGLSGGDASAPDVFAQTELPIIRGQQSTLSRLLASGEDAAEQTISILTRVDNLVNENADEVAGIVSNARIVTNNLATASGDIADVLSATGEVATGFRQLATQVGNVAGDLGETIDRVDVASFNRILQNVGTISGTLAESDESIAALLDNADQASGQLTTLLTQAGSFAQEARQAVAATQGVIGTVEGLAGAISADQVASIVTNVESATALVADNRDEITRIVGNAGDASERVSALLTESAGAGTRLNDLLDEGGAAASRVAALADAVDAQQISDTLASARSTAASVEALVAAVPAEQVTAIAGNVESATALVADNRDEITRIVGNAGSASERVNALLTETAGAGTRLNNLLDEGNAAASRVAALAASVDAQQIADTLASARSAAGSVEALVSAVPAEQVSAIVGNVENATALVTENGETITRIVNNAGDASDRLTALLAETVGAGGRLNAVLDDAVAVSTRLNALTDAADPEMVRATLASAASLSERLAGEADRLSRTLASAETSVANIAAATEAAPTLAADLGETLGAARTAASDVAALTNAIDPAEVNRLTSRAADLADEGAALVAQSQGLPASLEATLSTTRGAVRGVRGVLEAVDQTQIAAITDDVASVTSSVRAQVPQIEATLESARSAAAKADAAMGDIQSVASSAEQASQAARGLLDRLRELTANIDSEAIADTVNNARDITQTVADNREGIATALQEVTSLAERLSQSADRVDGILASTQGLVDEEARAFLDAANAAAQSLRTTSDQLNARVPAIADNLTAFSGRGLQGLTELITQGRSTVNNLNRVIGDVESNPEQFLFGRRGDATYTPRGRQ